jgi:hypothetical protein
MNFGLFFFLFFLMVGGAAQVAARIAAALAKGAVRAGILLRYLLVHKYILQSLTILPLSQLERRIIQT